MNRRVRTIVLAITTSAIILSVGSCRFFSFLNPAWALQGSWEITDKPAGPFWEAHTYLYFLQGAAGYEYQNSDREAILRATILNLTEAGFDNVIDENVRVPEYEGAEQSAEYSIDGDILAITFYADREQTWEIVSFVATRE